MTALKLEMNALDVAKVKLMLGAWSPAAGRVIQQSINRTLTGVRTDAVNEMAKVVTATKTTLRGTIKVKKMTAKDGNAYIKCKGKALDLSYFKARKTKKGITVQVLKTSGRSLIKHAFIVEVKNRKAGTTHNAAAWRKKENGKMVPRYQMKGLKTMAVPDVFSHGPTMAEILRLGGDRLKKNLNDRLNYELSKM